MTGHNPSEGDIVELLRRFEEVYSNTRGLPWIGVVRPEQAFGKAADEITRLRELLRISPAMEGQRITYERGFGPGDGDSHVIDPFTLPPSPKGMR